METEEIPRRSSTENGIGGKPGEIEISSALQLIVLYQG